MKVGDIVDLIESFASPLLAESYDNTGLLIGDREAETRLNALVPT
ncbi:MAG: hypothetical protein RR388_00725 [Rikenellaceae bacterium]